MNPTTRPPTTTSPRSDPQVATLDPSKTKKSRQRVRFNNRLVTEPSTTIKGGVAPKSILKHNCQKDPVRERYTSRSLAALLGKVRAYQPEAELQTQQNLAKDANSDFAKLNRILNEMLDRGDSTGIAETLHRMEATNSWIDTKTGFFCGTQNDGYSCGAYALNAVLGGPKVDYTELLAKQRVVEDEISTTFDWSPEQRRELLGNTNFLSGETLTKTWSESLEPNSQHRITMTSSVGVPMLNRWLNQYIGDRAIITMAHNDHSIAIRKSDIDQRWYAIDSLGGNKEPVRLWEPYAQQLEQTKNSEELEFAIFYLAKHIS